jgi:hypothetical protein
MTPTTPGIKGTPKTNAKQVPQIATIPEIAKILFHADRSVVYLPRSSNAENTARKANTKKKKESIARYSVNKTSSTIVGTEVPDVLDWEI